MLLGVQHNQQRPAYLIRYGTGSRIASSSSGIDPGVSAEAACELDDASKAAASCLGNAKVALRVG